MPPPLDRPYDVALTARAKRDIARLPEKVAVAAVEHIYGPIASNPQRLGRPLALELEGLLAARLRDYRIVYRIDDSARRVVIETIAHRSDVYRSR